MHVLDGMLPFYVVKERTCIIGEGIGKIRLYYLSWILGFFTRDITTEIVYIV